MNLITSKFTTEQKCEFRFTTNRVLKKWQKLLNLHYKTKKVFSKIWKYGTWMYLSRCEPHRRSSASSIMMSSSNSKTMSFSKICGRYINVSLYSFIAWNDSSCAADWNSKIRCHLWTMATHWYGSVFPLFPYQKGT